MKGWYCKGCYGQQCRKRHKDQGGKDMTSSIR